MSLETVVEDIRDEARARAEEIRGTADQQAEEIIAEAEAEAESIRQQREREVEQTIEQEREQRISSANLEAKQERLKARRDVLQVVREEVEQLLAGEEPVRTSTREPEDETKHAIVGEERTDLTRELLDGALAEFDDDPVQIMGRSGDEPLLRRLAEEYERVEYGGTEDCLGGVVVESTHSRVRVNNTFDVILESVWEDNLREISAELFEQ